MAAGASSLAQDVFRRARVWFIFRHDMKRKAKERTEILQKHVQRADQERKAKPHDAEGAKRAAKPKETLFEEAPPVRKGRLPPQPAAGLLTHAPASRRERARS